MVLRFIFPALCGTERSEMVTVSFWSCACTRNLRVSMAFKFFHDYRHLSLVVVEATPARPGGLPNMYPVDRAGQLKTDAPVPGDFNGRHPLKLDRFKRSECSNFQIIQPHIHFFPITFETPFVPIDPDDLHVLHQWRTAIHCC